MATDEPDRTDKSAQSGKPDRPGRPDQSGASGATEESAEGRLELPEGFLWGAAASAYQIEDSALADGAGVSRWHRFAHAAGCTERGETGDVACDHYRRYEE